MSDSPKAEQLAFDFIRRSGGKAHVSEVIDYVLLHKRYSGKTPRKTVSSIIRRSSRIKLRDRYCSI